MLKASAGVDSVEDHLLVFVSDEEDQAVRLMLEQEKSLEMLGQGAVEVSCTLWQSQDYCLQC